MKPFSCICVISPSKSRSVVVRCYSSPCCVEMTVKSMDWVVHHPTSKALKFTLCITMTMGQLVIRVRLHFFVFKLYVPFLLSDTSGDSPFYTLEWAAYQHFPFWNNQSHNKLITLQRNFAKKKLLLCFVHFVYLFNCNKIWCARSGWFQMVMHPVYAFVRLKLGLSKFLTRILSWTFQWIAKRWDIKPVQLNESRHLGASETNEEMILPCVETTPVVLPSWEETRFVHNYAESW